MSSLHSILLRIFRWMRRYKFSHLVWRFLRAIGLLQFGEYLFSLWFHKNPTQKMIQKMKDDKQCFLKHSQELKDVYNSLEDDRSRFVFENILKYRATSDWECLKNAVGKDNPKTQYFVPELQFSDHEIIVDCGAYDGDTTKLFFKKIPGCRVIALEPDETNFEALQKLKFEELKSFKCGAWSESTALTFSDNGGGTTGGTINISGNVKIEVEALDNLPECQAATYIKMDIEGAELEALKGAEKIIKKNRPKLAICIYHHPYDLFEIPLYIMKLNPDYRLFIHHHVPYTASETVLYAI